MHLINKLLSPLGLRLSRTRDPIPFPPEFLAGYERALEELRQNSRGLRIWRDLRYDAGAHPESYVDFECAFAAYHIGRICPDHILDVGSYRHFVLGLLARFRVTTIDVRSHRSLSDREVVMACDAGALPFPDNSFEAVLSLCALEHVGLGRYGDAIDLDADRRAFQHMLRVLRPGAHLVFTTTINRSEPSLAFNAHRIYDAKTIRGYCSGLGVVEEKFYSHKLQDFCSFDQITDEPGAWDLYCGCWRKEG